MIRAAALGRGFGSPGCTFDGEIHPELAFDNPTCSPWPTPASDGWAELQLWFYITTVPTPWLSGKHTIFGGVSRRRLALSWTPSRQCPPVRTTSRSRTLSSKVEIED